MKRKQTKPEPKETKPMGLLLFDWCVFDKKEPIWAKAIGGRSMLELREQTYGDDKPMKTTNSWDPQGWEPLRWELLCQEELWGWISQTN